MLKIRKRDFLIKKISSLCRLGREKFEREKSTVLNNKDTFCSVNFCTSQTKNWPKTLTIVKLQLY